MSDAVDEIADVCGLVDAYATDLDTARAGLTGASRIIALDEDETEILQKVLVRLHIPCHVRLKLSCRVCSTIQTPASDLPAAESRLGPRLLVNVMASKNLDGLPPNPPFGGAGAQAHRHRADGPGRLGGACDEVVEAAGEAEPMSSPPN